MSPGAMSPGFARTFPLFFFRKPYNSNGFISVKITATGPFISPINSFAFDSVKAFRITLFFETLISALPLSFFLIS